MNLNKVSMVANMTHELRTPLNGIIGLIDCAIDNLGNQSITSTEYLKPALNCSMILLNQINDILDNSKLKFKMIKISYTKTNIRSLVSEILQLFLRKSKLTNVALKSEISLKVPIFIMIDS